MKYRRIAVARAFVEAITEHPAKADHLIKNFVKFLYEKRLWKDAVKIIADIERLLLKKRGGRKILVETAAPLGEKARRDLEAGFNNTDVVYYAIEPRHMAGVRITVDDGLVIDGTLNAKLKKMFRR